MREMASATDLVLTNLLVRSKPVHMLWQSIFSWVLRHPWPYPPAGDTVGTTQDRTSLPAHLFTSIPGPPPSSCFSSKLEDFQAHTRPRQIHALELVVSSLEPAVTTGWRIQIIMSETFVLFEGRKYLFKFRMPCSSHPLPAPGKTCSYDLSEH